jgi:hypothetical protein
MKKLILLLIVFMALSVTLAVEGNPNMFINRVRLVQIFTGASIEERVALTPPEVFRTGPQGTVVETVSEAMALVPAIDRPPSGEWWQYIIQYEVDAHVVPDIIGVMPYTLSSPTVPLVVNVDFWQTEADRLAAEPPIIRNTFTFMFNTRPREFMDDVRRIVDDWMIQATFHSWLGDRRDPAQMARASTNPADDPRGLLTNTGLMSIDGVPRTLAAVWRP